MMLSKCKLIIFSLITGFLVGCATSSQIPPQFQVDPRVKILDTGFWGLNISIIDVQTVRNKSGLLEIQLEGMNNSDDTQTFEYKIEWFNKSGFIEKTILSRWTKYTAYKNSKFYIREIAPNPDISDFRILIRKGE